MLNSPGWKKAAHLKATMKQRGSKKSQEGRHTSSQRIPTCDRILPPDSVSATDVCDWISFHKPHVWLHDAPWKYPDINHSIIINQQEKKKEIKIYIYLCTGIQTQDTALAGQVLIPLSYIINLRHTNENAVYHFTSVSTVKIWQ